MRWWGGDPRDEIDGPQPDPDLLGPDPDDLEPGWEPDLDTLNTPELLIELERDERAEVALARITAYRSRQPAAGARVRQLAEAFCPTPGGGRVAGLYLVETDGLLGIWLWLCGRRAAPRHHGGRRSREGPRAVLVREAAPLHPPGCGCQPIDDKAATCRCCRADYRVRVTCGDRLTIEAFPRSAQRE